MALMLPGYLMRLTGAGDVKLMGALGALLGVEATIPVFLATFIAGGLVGSIYAFIAWSKQGATSPIARYKDMFQWFWMTGRLSYKPPAPNEAMAQRFPFGIAIALGTSYVLLSPCSKPQQGSSRAIGETTRSSVLLRPRHPEQSTSVGPYNP
jgi:prepilin peptidase CpaA